MKCAVLEKAITICSTLLRQRMRLKELWKEYHLNEDLLRFLTVTAEEVKEH